MNRLEQETDVDTLREAVRLLASENDRLTKLVGELQQALREANSERAEQLQFEIEDLKGTIARQRKSLFGDSSERRPTDVEPVRPPRNKKPGHGPRQQDLPVVERVHDLDAADRTCPSCGGQLEEWSGQYEDSTEIDKVAERFVQVLHRRRKYRCRCGGCIETAPAPPKLMKGGRYSIDIAVGIAVAKYADHMPLERMTVALGRMGLAIDSQTLWDQINALAKLLSPAHDALQAAVLSKPVIGADETHWKLLNAKSSGGKTKRWQVWAVTSDKAVSYRIKSGRALQDAADVLGGHRGVVVCDGYAVYGSLKKQHRGIELAHCWAHVRRKYVDVEITEPGRCTEVLDLIGRLFAVEQRARDGDIQGEALLALRAAESKPIVDAIHEWALAQRVLPKSPLGKAITYMGSLWDGLRIFLEHAEVPVDNNATERALRRVVLGRKNHYGSKSQRGTEVAALFYSLLETTRLVDVDPYDYLRDATLSALAGEPIPLPGDRDHGEYSAR